MSTVPIPLFWVDIPMAGEDIGLCAKASREKADKEVKLAEKLQPVGLPVGEEFQGSEVLQVLVVSHDINGGGRALKVVSPVLKSVMVEESPISFSLFSLADCTPLSHFSFNDFIAIAFPDLAGDLDIQI